MFRTVRLSIIRSLFTATSTMVYVIQVCRQFASRSICSCSQAVYKPVWHIPLLRLQWINSWWWIDELSETCRVSCGNKFVKLVHLVGFIKKNFVILHGNMSRCTVTCHDARSHNTMHGYTSWCRSHVTMHGHILRCTVHITMHGHISRCTVTCHDARSHITMHGHMPQYTVTYHDERSHATMHGHMPRCTVTCDDARSHERKKQDKAV